MPKGGKRILEFQIWAANMVRKGAQAAKRELAGLKRTANALTGDFDGDGLTDGQTRQAGRHASGNPVGDGRAGLPRPRRGPRHGAKPREFGTVFGGYRR